VLKLETTGGNQLATKLENFHCLELKAVWCLVLRLAIRLAINWKLTEAKKHG